MRITITFKKFDNSKLSTLLTKLSTQKGKFKIDFKAYTICLFNSEDTEAFIDIVNSFFDIDTITIDNDDTIETLPEKKVENNTVKEETSNAPVSVENIEVKPIKFNNPTIEMALNGLHKTAVWLLATQKTTPESIASAINTAKMELNYGFANDAEKTAISCGDIVDVYYGYHMSDEICGSHVTAIVCSIQNNTAYLVPTTSHASEKLNSLFLTMEKNVDFICVSDNQILQSEITAILDKGQFLNCNRLTKVIGKCTDTFFTRLLKKLPKAFTFSTTNEPEITKKTKVTKTTKAYGKNSKALKDFIESKEMFTIRELKAMFPEINKGTISSFLNLQKSKGLIISTSNRGEYKVAK